MPAGRPPAASSVLVRLRGCLGRSGESEQGIIAIVGCPEAAGAVTYNAASVLREGQIQATYKRDLPNYAVFDERRYFVVDPDGGRPSVIQISGVRVGLMICQDLWGIEPMYETAEAGAAVVVVPNASPFERDIHSERRALLTERASSNGCAIAYVNVVGAQDGIAFDGSSLLCDGDGHLHPGGTRLRGLAARSDQRMEAPPSRAGPKISRRSFGRERRYPSSNCDSN